MNVQSAAANELRRQHEHRMLMALIEAQKKGPQAFAEELERQNKWRGVEAVGGLVAFGLPVLVIVGILIASFVH